MYNFRTYMLVLFAAALASCANNDIDVPQKSQDYTLIGARTESDSHETRTYLGAKSGNQYPVYWSTGDTICLISESGNSKFALESDGSDLTYATFGGNASKMVGTYPGTLVYPAAYPVEGAFAQLQGGSFYVGSEVPTIQTFVNNLEPDNDTRCFADNTFPMAAVSKEPTEFQFYNLAGILRLKIFYEPDGGLDNDHARILRITLKGNDREKLSGPVAMQFNSETGEFVASDIDKDNGKALGAFGDNGKEKVIVDLSGCTGYTSGKVGVDLPEGTASTPPAKPLEVDLAVIPQTFENGFTVEIMDASTMGTQTYAITTPITIKRSEIKEMQIIRYLKPDPLEVANCYIASEPGEFMMPAFAFGNRMGTNFKDGYDGFDADKTNVDILWTDIVDDSGNKIDAITDIDYMKFIDGNNYVSYRLNENPATPGVAYRGNVMLALYNEESKEIYWTWHLWLCDQPQDVIIDGKCAGGSYSGVYPDGTDYNYKAYATYSDMRILDRNLGAIHAQPSECDIVEGETQVWQTYGLYYQDGRRDPFIGGFYNGSWNVSDRTTYQNDKYGSSLYVYDTDQAFGNGTNTTWTNTDLFGDERGWKFVSGNQTISQTLNNPQNYSYDNSKTKQWTYYLSGDNLSWMDSDKYPDKAEHGRTGLLYGDHEAYWNRTKTIFDPCPPGYSVLGERGGYFFGGAGTSQWYGNDTNGYGLMYTYSGTFGSNQIWWPAAGVRARDGKMAGVGEYGLYFFYDHIDADHGGHGLGFKVTGANSGSFLTKSNSDEVLTNHATPIRCVKAIQEAGGPDLTDPKKK